MFTWFLCCLKAISLNITFLHWFSFKIVDDIEYWVSWESIWRDLLLEAQISNREPGLQMTILWQSLSNYHLPPGHMAKGLAESQLWGWDDCVHTCATGEEKGVCESAEEWRSLTLQGKMLAFISSHQGPGEKPWVVKFGMKICSTQNN